MGVLAQLERWQNPPWWFALLSLPWVVATVFLVHDSRAKSAIAPRQHIAVGTITDRPPRGHNEHEYVFSVAGVSYRGWDSPEEGSSHVGNWVTVYYDSRDPNTNALVAYADRSAQDLGPVLFMAPGIVGIVGYVAYRRLRNGARHSAP